MLARDRTAGGKERDVDAFEVEVGEIAHDNRSVAELDLAAGGTFAGERYQLADRELALLEDGEQRFADRAGGAGDGDVEGGLFGHESVSVLRA